MNMEHGDKDTSRRSPLGFAVGVFVVAIALLLVLEHRAHLLGASPLLLFLFVCIGMHFLMHRGHGSHGDDKRKGSGDGN